MGSPIRRGHRPLSTSLPQERTREISDDVYTVSEKGDSHVYVEEVTISTVEVETTFPRTTKGPNVLLTPNRGKGMYLTEVGTLYPVCSVSRQTKVDPFLQDGVPAKRPPMECSEKVPGVKVTSDVYFLSHINLPSNFGGTVSLLFFHLGKRRTGPFL